MEKNNKHSKSKTLKALNSISHFPKSVSHSQIVKKSQWLSSNEEKRLSELLFLRWSAVWICFLAFLVATKLYMSFGDVEYFLLGLSLSLPYFFLPWWFIRNKKGSIFQSYWFKANVWISIFSYVGNYFWTHYFYKVLGATYTFPVKFQLNEVPVFLYFVTHGYFMFYHTLTTILLRRFWKSSFMIATNKASRLLWISQSGFFVFLLSYTTAFMEAFTVATVPYYVIQDRSKMYLIGSAFYGIYFYISFPMFFRMDEHGKLWTLSKTIFDALAAAMLVTIFLDIWRLCIGGVIELSIYQSSSLPWL